MCGLEEIRKKERNAESAKTDFYVRLEVLLSNAKDEKDAT